MRISIVRHGCDLEVDFYSQESMKIKGKIKRLEYV